MSELGKPFLRKIRKKNLKNWCQNAACEENTTSEK